MYASFKKIKIGLLLTIVSTPCFGIDLKPDEMRSKEETKPVSVLQQRFFSKKWRPELGALYGTFFNESYTVTTTRGLRLGLAFHEMWAVEAQYYRTTVEDSEDRKALNQMKFLPLEPPPQGEPEKTVLADAAPNPVRSMADVNVVFAPFYGKLNLVDLLIVYTDFYFTGGVSSVDTYMQGPKSAILLGAGQKFYMLKAWAFRLDFRDRIYTEDREGEKITKHTYHVDFGVSYYFL